MKTIEKQIFTNEKANLIKGIAILLMLTHHLFAFPDRLFDGNNYISILKVGSRDIEYIIAGFGQVCVALFLFISGFGFYMVLKRNGSYKISYLFNKIKRIYFNYWLIFILFVPVSFIFLIMYLILKSFY